MAIAEPPPRAALRTKYDIASQITVLQKWTLEMAHKSGIMHQTALLYPDQGFSGADVRCIRMA
jgi:hypothetical protein